MEEHKSTVETPSADGAVIGGLSGILSAGTAGAYTVEVTRSQADTNKEFRYTKDDKTEVTIESTNTTPRYPKGAEQVSLSCTYVVLSTGEMTVTMHEKRELFYNGVPCGSLEVKVDRKPGTYKSNLQIVLPHDAKRGTYTVRYSIQTDRSGDQRDAFFTIP
jgi:hypothetical protein